MRAVILSAMTCPWRLLLIGFILIASTPRTESAESPRVELTVLQYPAEVPAFSSFYVRVKLVNAGSTPLRGCVVEMSRIASEDPCLTLGYRFWQTPRRLDVSSVDTVQVLSRRDALSPGQSVERTVRLVSPRRSGTGEVHLYAISRRADGLEWVHEPVPIVVGRAPFEVRRREMITLALVAVYLGGSGWALVRIVSGIVALTRRPPCSP